jgi:hypothetical protein
MDTRISGGEWILQVEGGRLKDSIVVPVDRLLRQHAFAHLQKINRFRDSPFRQPACVAYQKTITITREY